MSHWSQGGDEDGRYGKSGCSSSPITGVWSYGAQGLYHSENTAGVLPEPQASLQLPQSHSILCLVSSHLRFPTLTKAPEHPPKITQPRAFFPPFRVSLQLSLAPLPHPLPVHDAPSTQEATRETEKVEKSAKSTWPFSERLVRKETEMTGSPKAVFHGGAEIYSKGKPPIGQMGPPRS